LGNRLVEVRIFERSPRAGWVASRKKNRGKVVSPGISTVAKEIGSGDINRLRKSISD